MKKALLSIVAVGVIAWVGLWGFSRMKENQSASKAWPGNLGPLDAAAQRFPAAEQSPGATKLVQLAAAADIDMAQRTRETAVKPSDDPKVSASRTVLGEYLKAQFERSGDAIDAPPPAAAQYLAQHDAALSAVRDHLLSGAPIVWETKLREGFNAPIPNLVGQMHLHRAFAARALDKARQNDPGAWNELRASWELNRGLWKRPDLLSILIALATTRMDAAAARKMPLPVPEWFREEQAFDPLAAMAASQQAESWTIHHTMPGKRTLRDLLSAPFYAFQGADAIEVMRNYTAEALRSNACDADSAQFATARASLMTQNAAVPNLIQAWHRAMRYRAESEATERILQMRAGQRLTVSSRCSDGSWQLTPNGMKFSRDIKVAPQGINFPLEYVR